MNQTGAYVSLKTLREAFKVGELCVLVGGVEGAASEVELWLASGLHVELRQQGPKHELI